MRLDRNKDEGTFLDLFITAWACDIEQSAPPISSTHIQPPSASTRKRGMPRK